MILNLSGQPEQSPGQASDLIKDTTTQTFVQDVIEPSRQVPVLVDFWAPWCGPCKQLTPVIEKLVKAANGNVRLVKMNIDDHPEVAGQLGVQSIPAVFAFKNGQPVDGFMGALPESQLRAFIERIAGKEAFAGSELEAAQEALAAGDINGAASGFANVLQQDSGNVDAIAGLTRCYVATGDLVRAEQTLGLAPPSKANAAPIASARAALELARKGEASANVDLSGLRANLERDPADWQSRFDLALALNAQGDRDGATDHLLEIIRRDREWNDSAARKQLVEFFEAWGPDDPMSVKGRQRLSTLLFS
ncbi:MAG: thioredoxin [Rhodomicrobiaceae bacterium]